MREKFQGFEMVHQTIGTTCLELVGLLLRAVKVEVYTRGIDWLNPGIEDDVVIKHICSTPRPILHGHRVSVLHLKLD